VLFAASVRRATGTVAGAFKPAKSRVLVKCEHGTIAEAENRHDAFTMVTDPSSFCEQCAAASGEKEQAEAKKLEERIKELKKRADDKKKAAKKREQRPVEQRPAEQPAADEGKGDEPKTELEAPVETTAGGYMPKFMRAPLALR
jgi:hypothetical protein